MPLKIETRPRGSSCPGPHPLPSLDFQRQHGDFDDLPGRKDDQSLDDVLEFPDVARPCVRSEGRLHLGGKALGRAAQAAAEEIEKMPGQQQDVIVALTQGGR